MKDANLTELVKAAMPEGAGEFRPCAVFDELLDCIRVIARDCSVTEIRINSQITVLQENYPEPGRGQKYVGFTIKGAKYFCHEQQIDLSAPLKITEILDAILASNPSTLIRIFVDGVARPLVVEEKIDRIDMRAAA